MRGVKRMDMAQSGERLFADARETIDEALRMVAFRRRLKPVDFEELRSFVMLKLIENDYARLRKHSSAGRMSAYLAVVVHRLYLDFQISRWGRWHPSAEARRRGATAVALERLIHRDGFEPHEAVEHLRTAEPVGHSPDALLQLVHALPVRHRPRFVTEEQIQVARATPAVDPIEQQERNARAKRLQRELTHAIAALGAEDRRILEMRFLEHRTVAQVASLMRLDAKLLYSRIRRLLDRVRERLESNGFGNEAVCLSDVAVPEVDLDRVFAAAAA